MTLVVVFRTVKWCRGGMCNGSQRRCCCHAAACSSTVKSSTPNLNSPADWFPVWFYRMLSKGRAESIGSLVMSVQAMQIDAIGTVGREYCQRSTVELVCNGKQRVMLI